MIFKKLCSNIETGPALEQIKRNPQLYGEFNLRTKGDSPHRESKDIWFRFVRGNISEHSEAQWYTDLCPGVKDIAYKVMREAECGELGGVLCTILPKGKKIYPHTDSGWHAERYRKFYVPLQADDGSEFVFDGEVIPASIGDAWEFDNTHSHWVNNWSNRDRIVLIICMR